MNEEQRKAVKKANLIYVIELVVIAIIFAVIASLEIANVLHISERHRKIFNIVTTVGFSYIFFDFIWMMVSKKHRSKNSLLDKILLLPLGIYLLVFDIIMYINWNALGEYALASDNLTPEWIKYCITSAYFYIVAIYLFEAIYHYVHPHPSILLAVIEDEKEKELKEESENQNITEEKESDNNKNKDNEKEPDI